MKMGGCIINFSKNSRFEKKIAVKNETKILKNLFFFKFFHNKWHLFMSNMNVECFQLSFDVYIVHIGQKLIFKNHCTKS